MEKNFRNCYTDDCYDCPNYEDCQGSIPDDLDYREEEELDEEHDGFLEELYENEQFAQDGDFDNMTADFYDDGY